MALIDDNDIQVHLPIDKFALDAMPDDLTKVKLDVDRIVRGRLANSFTPVTLAGWSAPGVTPEYIRALGGRLAAALLYRLRLAQDYPDDTEYAQQKYAEGMAMLEMVATGQIGLIEVVEVIDDGARLSAGHYTRLADPKFTMDSVF